MVVRLALLATMLRLNARQKAALSETFREFVNLSGGALILGQGLSGQQFSWELLAMGIGLWVACMSVGLWLVKEE